MNSTNQTNDQSRVVRGAESAGTASCRGPFTKTAFVALAGGIICTAFAFRSLTQQHWLVWYEFDIAVSSGYACVVATCVCAIRSRFSFNRSLATSLVGLLIAAYGLYFFHIAYTPDLFFVSSESEIQSYDVILLCDVDRASGLPQYRLADVLRNRTQVRFGARSVVPGFDHAMDKFLAKPSTGDQIIFFADVDDQNCVVIDSWKQVYSGNIAGFQDTASHLCDLGAFREFVTSGNQ